MSDPVPVKLAIQIRWRDLDALGHVNNAVYLTYFELARLAYIRAVLGADAPIDRRTLLPVDFQFILAEVTCHYRSPATLGDQLAATIWVSASGAEKLCVRVPDQRRGHGAAGSRGMQHAGLVRLCGGREPAGAGRDRGAHGALAGSADPAGLRHPQESGDRNQMLPISRGSEISLCRVVRPSPAAAVHRLTRASPPPSLPASPRPCRTPRRGAPSRSHRSHRTAPTASPPMSHRPRRPGCARLPTAAMPSPVHCPRPAPARPRRASGRRWAREVAPGPGDREAGAPRPRAPRRWIPFDPKPGPLPRYSA